MKTMKYLSMLLMMALCVGFASCGDDDDPIEEIEEETGIVGTWSTSGDGWSLVFRFDKDGSGSETLTEVDSNGNNQTTTLLFDYAFNESARTLKLYIKGSSVIENYTATLTGNTLMLTDSDGTWVLKR